MSEWEVLTLTEAGITLIDCDHKTPPPADQGLPYVAIPQMKDGYIDFSEARLISEEDFEIWTRKANPQVHDVVLSRRCNPGESAYVAEGMKFALGQNLVLLRSDGNLVKKPFLRWLIKSPAWWAEVKRNINVGAVFNSLKCGEIIHFTLPIPSIEEQEGITKTLACIDRKIENLRKQNETLEAIAQTLFKHWFIDFEFPNADSKPYKSSGGEMVRSPLGEIPAGWRVGQLGDVVKINADSISKDYEYSEIEYVDISSVGVGVLEGTTSYHIKEAPSRARRLVKHGDVIWSGVRPNRKSYLFISHPSDNLVVSTGFITLTPDLIPSSYLYSWVTTDAFVEYLTFNASGSAYPAVKAEHFEIAEVLLPDKFNLSRFHAVVEPMREKIYQNSCQIQTLTQTRDVLLPKLMSGKLRIRA